MKGFRHVREDAPGIGFRGVLIEYRDVMIVTRFCTSCKLVDVSSDHTSCGVLSRFGHWCACDSGPSAMHGVKHQYICCGLVALSVPFTPSPGAITLHSIHSLFWIIMSFLFCSIGSIFWNWAHELGPMLRFATESSPPPFPPDSVRQDWASEPGFDLQ
jgi:hypothetical protein